jgi:hypothetical protein
MQRGVRTEAANNVVAIGGMGANLVEATDQRANAAAHANQGASLGDVMADHDPASQLRFGDRLQQ